VNVAVAWGCVAIGGGPSLVDSPDAAMVWPREVPEHWPAPHITLQVRRFGFAMSHVLGRTNSFEENGAISKTDLYLIDLFRVGWPLQTLRWETWAESTISRNSQTVNRFAGHPAFTGWLTGLEPPSFVTGTNGLWKRLPIRPTSVLAFAANTIFYAALLWLLIPGPFALRRFARVRRGLCPACAYPCGESAVCSECGLALQQRQLKVAGP